MVTLVMVALMLKLIDVWKSSDAYFAA